MKFQTFSWFKCCYHCYPKLFHILSSEFCSPMGIRLAVSVRYAGDPPSSTCRWCQRIAHQAGRARRALWRWAINNTMVDGFIKRCSSPTVDLWVRGFYYYGLYKRSFSCPICPSLSWHGKVTIIRKGYEWIPAVCQAARLVFSSRAGVLKPATTTGFFGVSQNFGSLYPLADIENMVNRSLSHTASFASIEGIWTWSTPINYVYIYITIYNYI